MRSGSHLEMYIIGLTLLEGKQRENAVFSRAR